MTEWFYKYIRIFTCGGDIEYNEIIVLDLNVVVLAFNQISSPDSIWIRECRT